MTQGMINKLLNERTEMESIRRNVIAEHAGNDWIF